MNNTANKNSDRILSIDVFRGFTILTMIFVNDLSGIHSIPGWMKHAPESMDGMTFVDVVFPAFLFIVGMSIPFAIDKRIQNGDTLPRLLLHVLTRTFGLLLVGVYMVNSESYNQDLVGVKKYLWTLSLYLSVILIWNTYPRLSTWKKYLFWLPRILGFVALIYLATIYRGGTDGNIHWMKTSWWGILGLIGWAYLTGCFVYLLFRKNLIGLLCSFFLLVILNMAQRKVDFPAMNSISDYVWPAGDIGGHGSITMVGIILSVFLIKSTKDTAHLKKILWILSFALFLFACGYLVHPLDGISKDNATPAWCLYCSAICFILYAFLYYIIDCKKYIRWAGFLKPAGSNPLLAYILPSIVYSICTILSLMFIFARFNSGIPGILRSLTFALLILGLTGLLSTCKVLLKL